MEAVLFNPDTDPADVNDHLCEFGFAIVDDLADRSVLDRLDDKARPYIEASATGRDGCDGRFTRRTGSLIARCPGVRPLVMDPMVVATVHPPTTIKLHRTQTLSIEPGVADQELDRDQNGQRSADSRPAPPPTTSTSTRRRCTTREVPQSEASLEGSAPGATQYQVSNHYTAGSVGGELRGLHPADGVERDMATDMRRLPTLGTFTTAGPGPGRRRSRPVRTSGIGLCPREHPPAAVSNR